MKKLLLCLLCLLPLLAGCESLRSQRKDLEQLRLVETLGLDPGPDGVVLTLAASAGSGGEESLCYSAPGASVSEAMERLRDRSLENTLFCGHLQHLLLGESLARQGLDPFLAYVCRSSDVRLDLPVYVVLDSDAREAMTGTQSGVRGIIDALEALQPARDTGQSPSTAGKILRDLENRGCALVRTLRLRPNAEKGDAGEQIAAPEGFGILLDGRLAELIEPEEAVAAALLTETLEPCVLVLELPDGRSASLELESGSLRLRPGWDKDDKLESLELELSVRAVLLELDGFERAADEALRDMLNARLEAELSRRIGAVLQQARSLQADFLGLGSRIELQSPLRGRGMGKELGEQLQDLRIAVAVRGELIHNNDMD